MGYNGTTYLCPGVIAYLFFICEMVSSRFFSHPRIQRRMIWMSCSHWRLLKLEVAHLNSPETHQKLTRNSPETHQKFTKTKLQNQTPNQTVQLRIGIGPWEFDGDTRGDESDQTSLDLGTEELIGPIGDTPWYIRISWNISWFITIIRLLWSMIFIDIWYLEL